MDNQPIFDHEKLDVYRVSIEFQAWVGDLLDEGFGKRDRPRQICRHRMRIRI